MTRDADLLELVMASSTERANRSSWYTTKPPDLPLRMRSMIWFQTGRSIVPAGDVDLARLHDDVDAAPFGAVADRIQLHVGRMNSSVWSRAPRRETRT
jgi:hypothetical protein